MTVPVPNPITWTVGQIVAAADMNANVRDAVKFLTNPPILRAHQSAAQTLTTSVPAAITFDVNDVDSYSGHSTVTNNSRYVAQVPGWYWVEGVVYFSSNASGRRLAQLAKNGTVFIQREVANAGSPGTPVAVSDFVQLNVGDYIEVLGDQTSGANLATQTQTTGTSTVVIKFIHS